MGKQTSCSVIMISNLSSSISDVVCGCDLSRACCRTEFSLLRYQHAVEREVDWARDGIAMEEFYDEVQKE